MLNNVSSRDSSFSIFDFESSCLKSSKRRKKTAPHKFGTEGSVLENDIKIEPINLKKRAFAEYDQAIGIKESKTSLNFPKESEMFMNTREKKFFADHRNGKIVHANFTDSVSQNAFDCQAEGTVDELRSKFFNPNNVTCLDPPFDAPFFGSMLEQIPFTHPLLNKPALFSDVLRGPNRCEMGNGSIGGAFADKNLNILMDNNGILALLNCCLQRIPFPPLGSGTFDALHILYNHTMFQAFNFQKCVLKYLAQLQLKNHLDSSQNRPLKDTYLPMKHYGISVSPVRLPNLNKMTTLESGNQSIQTKSESSHILRMPKSNGKTEGSPHLGLPATDISNSYAIDLSMNSGKTNCERSNFTEVAESEMHTKYLTAPHSVYPSNGRAYAETESSTHLQGNSESDHSSSGCFANFTPFLSRNYVSNNSFKGNCVSSENRRSRHNLLRNKKNKPFKGTGILNNSDSTNQKGSVLFAKKASFRGTSEEENEVCPQFKPLERDGQVVLSENQPSVTLPKEVYQSLIIKSSASATRLIRLLMKSFFNQEELAASSLSGEGIYKKRLQPEITEAIKAFIRKRHPQLKTGSINLCMTDVCVQARRVANNQRSRVRTLTGGFISAGSSSSNNSGSGVSKPKFPLCGGNATSPSPPPPATLSLPTPSAPQFWSQFSGLSRANTCGHSLSPTSSQSSSHSCCVGVAGGSGGGGSPDGPSMPKRGRSVVSADPTKALAFAADCLAGSPSSFTAQRSPESDVSSVHKPQLEASEHHFASASDSPCELVSIE